MKEEKKKDNTATQIDDVLDRLNSRADPACDFATQKWAPELRILNRKSSWNGFATQMLGIARVVFTIPVPLLAGLGLQGNGATAVRWLTFGLSLTAAVIAAYVGIRGYEPRWRLYHKYANWLLGEGWLYVEQTGDYLTGVGSQQPGSVKNAALFAQHVCSALTTMNNEYDNIVHSSATPGGRTS